MKQFLKIFFASLLAFIIGLFLSVFLFIGILSIIVASAGDKNEAIGANSILQLSLNRPLTERSTNNPFENFNLNSLRSRQQPGLNDILKSLDKAARDNKIKGIYIDMSSVQSGMAMLEELRNGILKFKKSKKFVYAYAESYSQSAYYLASAADVIYLNPQGIVDLHGMMAKLMFFKGTLDKLEVEPQLIRHGKYKSAGETFVMEKMSSENRDQVAALVNGLWNNIVAQIAASRKIAVSEVGDIADSLRVRNADDALRYRLVDKLAYYDEFAADVNRKLGNKVTDKLPFITIGKYRNAADPLKEKFTSDRIAVIYATGEIQSGEGDNETMGADKIADAVRKARTDKNIKGIVIRVNSPGGSALASEIIWREVSLAAKAKPLVVSMSDVAASGGYYISCGAKKIIAQQNTITGSIGVFGLLFNAEKLLKNKLGITFDGYQTGAFTDLGAVTRPLTRGETIIIQQQVDQVYLTFTKRVSDGRQMPVAVVDSLGQGRVWGGTDALKNNLIDSIGGLDDAVAMVSKMAGISNYRIKEMPEQKDAMRQILQDISDDASMWVANRELGEQAKYLKALRSVLRSQGIMTRMDSEIIFED